MDVVTPRPRWVAWAGSAAALFGILTLISGGTALFGGPAARAAVGNAVPFVLWFNFLAGFAYVAAGAGIVLRRAWAVPLAGLIAGATVLVFAAFLWHVAGGGAYEARTVGALLLRSGFWSVLAVALWRRSKN